MNAHAAAEWHRLEGMKWKEELHARKTEQVSLLLELPHVESRARHMRERLLGLPAALAEAQQKMKYHEAEAARLSAVARLQDQIKRQRKKIQALEKGCSDA